MINKYNIKSKDVIIFYDYNKLHDVLFNNSIIKSLIDAFIASNNKENMTIETLIDIDQRNFLKDSDCFFDEDINRFDFKFIISYDSFSEFKIDMHTRPYLNNDILIDKFKFKDNEYRWLCRFTNKESDLNSYDINLYNNDIEQFIKNNNIASLVSNPNIFFIINKFKYNFKDVEYEVIFNIDDTISINKKNNTYNNTLRDYSALLSKEFILKGDF